MTTTQSPRQSLDNPDVEKATEATDTETITKETDSAETATEDVEYPSAFPLALITMAVMFSVFLSALDQTIVGTAIPKITDEFHNVSQVSWFGSAYFMTFGGFQTSWGKIYTYYNLKVAFLVAVFIFELGSLVCGVAPNTIGFIFGRAIAGLGGAGMATGAFTIIALSVEPRRRPAFVGISGATRFIWAGSLFQFFFAGAYFLILYYLPIYFQSIQNVSAIESGVRNLPIVITISFGVALGGFLVGKTGWTVPFMAAGAAICAIAFGLFRLLDFDTSTGKWIGYQILAGVGVSVPFQITINIAQANAKTADISKVTAMLFFFQIIGGAFSLAAAQAAFLNTVIKTASSIDRAQLIASGATQLRQSFTADQLPIVLDGYLAGIRATFNISIAMMGVSFLASFLSSFKNLHEQKAEDDDGSKRDVVVGMA
ncbi:hypothetical protein ZTR_02273 [Talaromyces verruculosus]|nr:hypothetical protein ZTR_02273 [Talaromyces verruculosus]